MRTYCKDCGVSFETGGLICFACISTWEKMPRAREALEVIHYRDSRCCEGFSKSRDHYYFHGKGWEWGDKNNEVCVEAGVQLYPTYALTYWTYDDDVTLESRFFGGVLRYPDADSVEEWSIWYDRLMKQLSDAPEDALDEGIYTCKECGYHNDRAWVLCCPEPTLADELAREAP